MPDAAGSPSTARDRAIETAVTSAVLREVAGFRRSIEVDALAALMETLPIVVENAVRLVPAGGSAPADEVERLTWERDMALSRVAAAEDVQVRMGESLPASGPVDSWSERDRAVRDYEGDLSAALATETDTVGERLREVERERDEARQERDDKVVELTITRAVLTQQTHKRDEARAAVRGLVDNYAAHDQQAFEAAHEAANAVLAGGSAPHQGATTADAALRRVVDLLDFADGGCELSVTAEVDTDVVRMALVDHDGAPSDLRAAVRALLGAGETTEETHG